MRATLNLQPSVRLIEAALEGLVSVNRVLIETSKVPPSPLDSRVRYKRESSGLEEWDNAYTCMKRGWGDCEDLNAWECARINIEEDPDAICTLIKTGRKLFHCVILLSDGSYQDVCPALGMRVPGTSLEGLPWLEVAGPYVPKRSARVDNRTEDQRNWDRNHKRFPTYATKYAATQEARPETPKGYVPKASQSQNRNAYTPKSSRADRPKTPSTRTQDEDEAVDALVSPTSTSAPQATQAVPMQSYAEDVLEEAESLAEPMDGPLEDEDEDEMEMTL